MVVGGHWLVLCGFGLTFELYLGFPPLNSGHQRCLPGQHGSQPAVHSPPMPQAWTEQDSSHLAPAVGRPPPVATLPRPAECARLPLGSPCWAPFLQTEPSQLTLDEIQTITSVVVWVCLPQARPSFTSVLTTPWAWGVVLQGFPGTLLCMRGWPCEQPLPNTPVQRHGPGRAPLLGCTHSRILAPEEACSTAAFLEATALAMESPRGSTSLSAQKP